MTERTVDELDDLFGDAGRQPARTQEATADGTFTVDESEAAERLPLNASLSHLAADLKLLSASLRTFIDDLG